MNFAVLGVGVAFMVPFVVSSAFLVQARRRLASWSPTSATILAVWTTKARMGTGGNLVTTWIRYSYVDSAGQSQSGISASPDSEPMTGKTVEVRYDPSSPNKSATTAELRGYGMTVAILVVTFVPGALMVAWAAGVDLAEYLLSAYFSVLLMAPLVITVAVLIKKDILRPTRWTRATATLEPYGPDRFYRAGGNVVEPHIAYRFVDADGNEHRGSGDRPKPSSCWGDTMEIEYDAANPERSRTADGFERIVVWVTVGGVLAMLFGVGAWMLVVSQEFL
ncbi:MAG: DUF3592 domain-containing protein [Nocardioidaceae bacterium]